MTKSSYNVRANRTRAMHPDEQFSLRDSASGTDDATEARDKALAAIAKRCLGVETLETRGWDRLDFHDCGVASIKSALEEAFLLGQTMRGPLH